MEWGFIHPRIEKRKRSGKESEVFINDIQIPAKKLKKEISRRFPPTLQQRSTSGIISMHRSVQVVIANIPSSWKSTNPRGNFHTHPTRASPLCYQTGKPSMVSVPGFRREPVYVKTLLPCQMQLVY